ncbi:MAG: putative metalloprotease [Acidimicrobiales bacterium]|nr:putative metalloprotease [Acidimicrobiales bacterium]
MDVIRSSRRHTAVVAVSLASLLAGCGVEATGGGAAERSRGEGNGDVIGSDITPSTEPAPTTTAPPPPDIEVLGDDGSRLNQVAANAIADLQDFWAEAYPAVFGGDAYEPVAGGFYAIDSTSDASVLPCAPAAIDDVLYNAYYCPDDDAVAWDQEGLFPDLAEQFGDFTVAVVMAHEWGHAIQDRARLDESTVTLELQADCFAGAWVRHVSDGGSRFEVTTEDLDLALAGVLSLRDAPGSAADDPNAHGSGFDRVGAFQDGFEDEASRCAEYRDGDPAPYQFVFTDQADFDSGGNMPLTSSDPDNPGIDVAAIESLELFWTEEYPSISGGDPWEPLGDPQPFSPADPPTCNGETVEDFLLFYCVPDRYVGYDVVDTMPEVYQLGDFAVGFLLGTQYGLAVQDGLGSQVDDERTTTLQADCYTGAWAGALLPTEATNQGEDLPYGLILSPGDLDEAVQQLLSSDADRERQGAGFERVRAFRTGVVRGADECASLEADG